MSGGFQRPGSLSKGAFGVSFSSRSERDRQQQQQQQRQGRAPPALHDRGASTSSAARHAPPGGASAAAPSGARALPAARHRRQLLYLVETHATVVLIGETGSGKTTLVPQLLLAAGWADGGAQIVCTQPRRAAAAAAAARVADELGSPLGADVGYAVRFEEVGGRGCRLRYVTDGVLLREMMDDPLLARYSVVIVDEAHERALATDALLGLLKKVQRRRPDLRVVVSSATLDVGRLLAFFDAGGAALPPPPSQPQQQAKQQQQQQQPGLPASRRAAVLSLEGRAYPVQVHYLTEPCPDYVAVAVQTAVDIHREDVPGDILIFLTGQEEVEEAVRLLSEEAERLRLSRLQSRLLALPLYSGLPGAQQRAALAPAARGTRKVVVATNVAETSLTIEGVVYVVDCCFTKQRCYDPRIGLESLLVAPASKASATQRAGRAGRVRAGHCFRLCTEGDFESLLPAAAPPEMQRADLAGLLLQLKALGVDNAMRFDWPAPPPAEAVVRGLEALHALGALDGDAKLTRAVGVPLAVLPLEPPLGAALLAAAARFGCADHMLLLCGLASVPSIWAHAGGGGQRRARDAAVARFAVAEGDFVTMLNAHRAWAEAARSSKWAARHFLNHHALTRAEETAKQLRARLARLGLLPRDAAARPFDLASFIKAVAAGFFMSAAQFERTEYDARHPQDGGTHVYRLLRHTRDGAPPKLRVHASSALWRVRPDLVVFQRCQQSGDGGWFEMQGVTAVAQADLLEVAPHYFQLQR